MAEYSTNLNPTPQVAYLTNDHLGSPRINTDENGAVISRHDYRPYGEEIIERTHAQYVCDTIRKQFTGYERDNETDLDFAQARYYSNVSGRFSSPDESFNDSKLEVAQSWNLYTYTRNNPINLNDPSGETADVTITIERKVEDCTIVVKATIGIWTQNNQITGDA
ncbi:MAG: hypothetical protein IPK58_18455 [Acidobacteria bacterium]|nr:hypothetical protein [Acidobacteriota bacterium]